MNATFITQQQFNDIESCVSYQADATHKVWIFDDALYPTLKIPRPTALHSHILEGEKQMADWNQRYYEASYKLINQVLTDALHFFDYLTPQLKALATVHPDGLSTTLAKISAPPGSKPAYAIGPITNCLQAYDHYVRMLAFAVLYTIGNRDHFNAMRNSFAQVLPRVIDFMSVHLQVAERMNLPADRLKTARDVLTDARGHYPFGMNGMANLMAQQSRIHTLARQVSQRFNGLVTLGNLRRFRADLEVIHLQAKQAQRYCGEILALRHP